MPQALWSTRSTVLFVVAVCASIFAGSVIPEISTYRVATRQAVDQSFSQARLFIQHAEDTFHLVDNSLLFLRQELEAGTAPTDAMEKLRRSETEARSGARPFSFYIMRHDGDLVGASDPNDDLSRNNHDRGYFWRHENLPDREVLVGDPIFGRGTSTWVVTLSRRLNDPAGAFAGVVSAVVELDYFVAFYAHAITDPRISVLLARRDGTVLTRFPFVDDVIGMRVAATRDRAETRPATADGNGLELSPVEKEARLVASAVGKDFGLSAFVSMPRSAIWNDWLSDAWPRGLVRMLMTLCIGWLGLRVLRQMRSQRVLGLSLQQREAEFLAVAEGAALAILRLTRDGHILYASPAAPRLFACGAEELLERPMTDFISPDDVPAVLRRLERIAALPDVSSIIEYRLNTDGAERWHAMTVQSSGTAASELIAIIRDETPEKERQNELAKEANTDPLTHLANRRRMEDALATEWRRAARDGTPLSLLFVDADRFKAFNDSYGHTEGDACLRAIAAAVQESASRAGDLAARFGGEEFVVVLPGTDAAGALVLAERVRSGVRDLAIPHRLNAPFGVATVSIGVATALPGQTLARPEELIAEADRALYRAKSTGRNRASFAEPSLHWDASAALRQSG